MLIATLLVISLTAYANLREENRQGIENIRKDGESLTRVLSSVPFRQLAQKGAASGVLENIKTQIANSELAYVAIVDSEGDLLNLVSAEDSRPPKVSLDKTQSLWLNEHQLFDPEKSVEILEFRSPLLDEGTLAGHIRTGYYLSGKGMSSRHLFFFAQIALPIFCLMMFFYFMLRRALLPMHEANTHLAELIKAEETMSISADADNSSQSFIRSFNHFLSHTQNKQKQLKTELSEALTSANLLAYHKRQVESVLQTLHDAVVVMDESGLVTFANQKLEAFTGVGIEDVMGKHPQEWCQDQNVVALLSRYQGNVTSLHRMESVKYCPEDYPEKTIDVSAVPLFSPKNHNVVLGTLIIFKDISTEVQLRESRDEFISHVSHELKSPLNIMCTPSEPCGPISLIA